MMHKPMRCRYTPSLATMWCCAGRQDKWTNIATDLVFCHMSHEHVFVRAYIPPCDVRAIALFTDVQVHSTQITTTIFVYGITASRRWCDSDLVTRNNKNNSCTHTIVKLAQKGIWNGFNFDRPKPMEANNLHQQQQTPESVLNVHYIVLILWQKFWLCFSCVPKALDAVGLASMLARRKAPL